MAALSFDAVIEDKELQNSLKRSTRGMNEFSKSAVAEFDKVDAAVKKTSQNVDKLGSAGKTKKLLDLGPQERTLLGFNQKLERTSREMGVTFTRAGRESLGFSNTFNSSISSAERSYQKFAGTAAAETSKISSSFQQLAGAAIGISAVAGLAQLPGQIVKVRGEFQNLEIAFETMLGNKAKADKLMSEVVQLAATTPFGLKDAAQATKQLLAYGSASTQVITELRRLGDVAAGVGVPIGDLTYLYGTLRAQGRAFAVDIRQFAGRGIPIYAELAKVLKINVDQVNTFVEQGKVGFKEVEQAFVNMTGKGGMFFNLMEKQSKSLAGLSSQLGDAVDIMFNDMGRSQEGFLASTLTGTIGLVQNYEKVIDALKIIVTVYGSYKAAIILASAAMRANLILTETMAVQQSLAAASGVALSSAQLRAAATTSILQQAQARLNATMLANPYVLAATALIALISYFVIFEDYVDEVEVSQRNLAKSSSDIASALAKESASVKTLVAEIKGLKGNRDEQEKSIKKLVDLNPELLGAINSENIATAESVKAIDKYIEAKGRQIRTREAELRLSESIERAEKAKKGGFESSFGDRVIDAMGSMGNQYATANSLTEKYGETKKRTNKQILETEEQLQKKLLEEIKTLREADVAATQKGTTAQKVTARTVEAIDKEIEAERKLQGEKSTTRKEYLAFEEKIKKLESERSNITGKLSAESKKAAKEAEKSGPAGSVAYWEYVKNAAEEVLSKTPTENGNLVAARKQAVVDAEEQLEEARRRTAVRSFEEEVAEKRRIYMLYNEWVTRYGKEAADAQFEDMRGQGDSYVDYLTAQIDKLRSIAQFTPLKDKDEDKLAFLTGERDKITGKESAMDMFKKSIDAARDSSDSLTEQLVKLRAIQAELGNAPKTADDYEKAKVIAEEIVQAERERIKNLTAYLQSVEGSGAKELEITKHYADLRATVEREYSAGRIKDRQKTLDQISKSEQEELTETRLRAVEGSKAFRDLNIQSTLDGRAALKERVDKEKAALHELEIANLEYTDKYKEQVVKVKLATKDLADYNKTKFFELADSIGALGEAVANLGGDNAGIASMLGNMAQGVAQVSRALEQSKKASADGESNMQGYIQVAQTAVQLIGMVINAGKERKAAEAQYYESVLAYENEYQKALNTRIRLQSINDENMFLMDYSGRIEDGVAAYADAQRKYLEAVERVAEEGKAKSGQKNKVDWGKVGSGAASGAAAGATFGPWGAAIGGVVGAAVGFFGGKKKKDVFSDIGDTFTGIIEMGADGFSHLNKEMAEAALKSGLLDDKTKALVQTALDYADAMEQAKEQVIDVLRDLTGSIAQDLKGALVEAFAAGEDSAMAFKRVVGNVIQGMITDLLYAQIFDSLFDDLQKDLMKSADVVGGGDGVYVDDIIKFMEASGPAVEAFNEALAAAQAEAEKKGLSILQNPNGAPAAPQSMTGAIATISQQSADELNGQFNAMRINQAQMLVVTNNMYFVMEKIQTNTMPLPEMRSIMLEQLIYLRNLDQPISRNGG